MKKILVILLFLLQTIVVFAQETKGLDLIVLKNGTRLYGKIVENKPDEIIKMETEAGSIMEVKYKEVKAVMYEVEPEEEVRGSFNIKKQRAFHIPESGVHFSAGGNINVGNSELDIAVPLPYIWVATGYRFNAQNILAAGTGFFAHELMGYVPFHLEYKYEFLKKSVSPYLSLKGGILVPVLPDTPSSFFLNPTIGIRLPSRRKTHTILFVGYTHFSYDFRTSNRNWGDFGSYNAFSTGAGIQF